MMSSFLGGMGGYMPSNLDYSQVDVPGMIKKEEQKQGLQNMLKGIGKNKKLQGFDYGGQAPDTGPSTAGNFLQMLFGV